MSRKLNILWVISAFLLTYSGMVSATPATFTDTTPTTATHDGTVSTSEYAACTAGINAGFGGYMGAASSLCVDSDENGAMNIGFISGGDKIDNNAIIIYIDSGSDAGFTSTANFTDSADPLRIAISGYNGTERTTLTFAPGFKADYAIGISGGYAGLWQLIENAQHPHITSVNAIGNNVNDGAMIEIQFELSDLGLEAGDSFKYVVTYISQTAWRSNEFYGVAPKFDAGNFGHTDATLAEGDFITFNSYKEAVPTNTPIEETESLSPYPTSTEPTETLTPEPTSTEPTETLTPEPTSTEPTETLTPEPTSTEPTETLTPEPTSTEPTETLTPEPTSTEPTATATATATATEAPLGTELIVNGGFEAGEDGWKVKNATKDKVKTNKPDKEKFFAYAGENAFMFKGGANENSKILQKPSADGVSFVAGDTLTFSLYVNAKKAPDAKYKVVVKYSDSDEKSKINGKIDAATEGYVQLSGNTAIISANVSKIKALVANKSASGKFFVDAVSLQVSAGASDGLLPLPR